MTFNIKVLPGNNFVEWMTSYIGKQHEDWIAVIHLDHMFNPYLNVKVYDEKKATLFSLRWLS